MFMEQQTPEDFGYIHEDDMPDYENIKDMFTGVLEVIYKGRDVNDLDFLCEEICGALEIPMPSGPILVQHKQNEEELRKQRMFQWFTGYTRAHAEFIRGVR